ncbi:MAG: hypothetical protein LCH59_12865 [Proteobacteria bacterium]|nr:hypothetical protein [Pseudomonadota bacterium]
MQPQNRIRRHGYHLVSLASIGTISIALFGLMSSVMPWLTDWDPQWDGWKLAGLSWQQTLAMNPQGKLLLSLSGIVWTLAYLMPLGALRRLGDRLYRNDPLTRPVADAFRRLAHSLPLYALLNVGAAALAAFAGEVGGGDPPRFTFGFSGVYLFLVATLCLYSIAHTMRLATEAADDSRSIV